MVFLQGDVTGPSLFNDVYSGGTETRRTCMQSALFTGDFYDASSTIFADDITKRTVTKTPQELITKVGKASKKHRCRRHEPKQRTKSVFVGPWVSQVDAAHCTRETNGLRIWGNCVLRRWSWVHCSHTIVAVWLRDKPAFGQHRLAGQVERSSRRVLLQCAQDASSKAFSAGRGWWKGT